VLRVEPDPDDESRIGCPGDSGSPAIAATGFVAGVLSGGQYHPGDGKCSSIERTFYTAFEDTSSMTGGQSNYDWTRDTIDTVCTQWQNVIIQGQGTVSGDLIPMQRKELGAQNNSVIGCPGDCVENFHQATTNFAAQTMTMHAAASDGWHFVNWISLAPPLKKCQCDGSADPDCFVTQDVMGYYDDVTSIDEDDCIAVFEPDMPHPDGGCYDPSGNGCCDPTQQSCGGPDGSAGDAGTATSTSGSAADTGTSTTGGTQPDAGTGTSTGGPGNTSSPDAGDSCPLGTYLSCDPETGLCSCVS
jgi:hypothetical protein